MRLLPDLHQDLLHDVLGVLMVVQDPVDRRIKQAAEFPVEFLKGGHVAPADSLKHGNVRRVIDDRVLLGGRGRGVEGLSNL